MIPRFRLSLRPVFLRSALLRSAIVACLVSGMPARALPAWTPQDDLSFAQSFAAAYYNKTGSIPSSQQIQASLGCARAAYAQAAASGADVPSAIRSIVSICQNSVSRSQLPGQMAGSGSSTLFNSSGDASLSSDGNGCLYYSSGPYSFSNC